MKRAHLHLLLVISLVLAPLHHVLAMQAPAAPACAEMGHHGGDMHSAGHDHPMDNQQTGNHAHGDSQCSDCAGCTHCAAALATSISMPHVAGATRSPELRVTMRSVDSHPDLRPPRFS